MAAVGGPVCPNCGVLDGHTKECLAGEKIGRMVWVRDEPSGDWYKDNIEEGVRDLVQIFRDNGINTECSCHHESPMYIQCQYIPDAQIKVLHDLICNHLSETRGEVNFEIHMHHEVRDGHSYSHLDVKIPQEESVKDD